jgi:hypothetical protein
VTLINLTLGHEALIACELSETLSTAEEDVCTACLREEEKHEDEDRG